MSAFAAPHIGITVPRLAALRPFATEDAFSATVRVVLQPQTTFLGPDRLHILWQAVRNTAHLGLPTAEAGCYLGGSARFLAEALRHWGGSPEIHLIDPFGGTETPVPTGDRDPHGGKNIYFEHSSLPAARAAMLPFPRAHFHVGFLEDVSPELEGLRFGMVHLDTDLYASILHGLRFFWPRMPAGGVVVVDDYGKVALPGVSGAVDEFFEGRRDGVTLALQTGQLFATKVQP